MDSRQPSHREQSERGATDIRGAKHTLRLGTLDLRLSGDTLYFSGKVETHNAKDDEFLGTAQLSGQGPVSNNQVAAYYDYTNERVQGFGTAFMQFDYAGKVFRVTTGEGTVGFVAAKLTR